MRGLRRFPALALALGLAMSAAAATAQVLQFAALPGWAEDDHLDALQTFRQTCDLMTDPDWTAVCRLAADAGSTEASARAFFELLFKPVLIGDPPALFTGYFEPELDGSPVRTSRFAYPIYRRPPELQDGAAWYDRATIDRGILRGRGLELAWLEDPVDVYFLQVQGSGRIRMPDGHMMRVGYSGRNGHAYLSVGQEMVRRGTASAEQVSAQSIQDYVRANPGPGADLLNTNPSYVFFRRLDDLSESLGPIGAMGRSVTPLRSVAIDPEHIPLGAPIWVEKEGADPMHRLMIAQDTGGAIKGAQRADIFYGTGRQAGLEAGAIKDAGRLIVLLPIDRAYAMLPEG